MNFSSVAFPGSACHWPLRLPAVTRGTLLSGAWAPSHEVSATQWDSEWPIRALMALKAQRSTAERTFLVPALAFAAIDLVQVGWFPWCPQQKAFPPTAVTCMLTGCSGFLWAFCCMSTALRGQLWGIWGRCSSHGPLSPTVKTHLAAPGPQPPWCRILLSELQGLRYCRSPQPNPDPQHDPNKM